MNVPFLGELALDPAVRIGGDNGKPIALSTGIFSALAERLLSRIAQVGAPHGPTVTITD